MEREPGTATASSRESAKGDAPPFDPAVIEDLLRQFDKMVRAYQLYPKDNPTYRKTVELTRTAFAAVWEHTDTMSLQVTDTDFSWADVVVLSEPQKVSDSLPWTLFKDGLREITFARGFEAEELEQFLDIIPRVRRAQDHEDDIITLLWEGEFNFLTYRFLDNVSVEGAPLDPSATPGRWPASSSSVRVDPKEAIAEARNRLGTGTGSGTGSGSGVGMGSGGGGTGYGSGGAASHLEKAVGERPAPRTEPIEPAPVHSGAHMSYLAREIDREYSTDLHRAVLDVLLDIFEVQSSPEVRDEVARHLDALSLHLLTGQQFSNVTHLLNESAHTLSRLPDLSDELRERIERIADRVSDPALLGPLLDSLNKSATPPPLDDLTALFNRLRPRALGTLFIWSEQAKNPAVRTRIAEAADRLALAGTEELVKLIGSPDHREALEAAHRAGVMCVDEAVPALVRMLGHQSDDLRAAALGALSEISTPRAISGIERALDDSSRGIRVAAIKALTTAVHKPALRRVTQAIEERGNREMDTNELRALFELYGLLCGDAGIPLLDEILNGSRGFFKRREDTETRACAAAALGNVNSPAAQESLKRALSEKDPVLRRAVSRALGGRTQ